MKNNYKQSAKSRSDLLTLLSEACEIEHGLACSYLYAAFSFKQSIEENISWEQLHKVKKWAAQIFFVASEEMLHLAQVWNLITAFGGVPYYARPNFPLHAKYFHFQLPVSLEPFSEQVIKRFKMYELPKHMSEHEYVKKEFDVSFEDGYTYKTVGDLYELIAEGIKAIPEEELFIGDPSLQVGPSTVDFPDIIKVTDRASALSSIELIVEQGEGATKDSENNHYSIFCKIHDEYLEEINGDPNFNPCRSLISNPVVYAKGNLNQVNGNLLENKLGIQISDLFDDLYVLMMQVLQHAFYSSDMEAARDWGKFAIHLMPAVIKPLADSLSRIDAGKSFNGLVVGPSFTLNRHVAFPHDFFLAKILMTERLSEIIHRGNRLLEGYPTPPKEFKNAIQNLVTISQKIIT